MISSIKFTGKGENDYLTKRKIVKELKPGKTIEDYDKAKQSSRRRFSKNIDDEFFNYVESGFENDRANKALVGNKISFERDRINVIFGPNACGKSTILKAIAGYTLCGSMGMGSQDGFTNVKKYQPINYGLKNDKPYKELKAFIRKDMQNDAKIDWDGNLVYYHNFDNRRKTGTLDDYEDSIFGDMGNVLNYIINKNKMSSGKQTLNIFSYLYKIVKSRTTVGDIIKQCENDFQRYNETWIKVYSNTISYLKTFEKWDSNDHMTLLIDEPDKSLDINSTKCMFSELIPELHSINNDQIIVVSHSPLVLSEDVCSKDKYNIISLMPEYTEYVKELFRNLKF